MGNPNRKITVWDAPTRLFHIALIACFAMSAYSGFQSKFGLYGDMHLYSGVAVIALIIWRIVWGFIGSKSARFSYFLKGPKAILAYIRDPSTHKYGHNPLGGYSVILMLVLLLAQAIMGLFANDDILFEGPFANTVSNSRQITGLHKDLGIALLVLIGIHILAVLFYLLAKKINLITPMITGKARVGETIDQPTITHWLWAILTAGIVGYGTYWYILT